MVVKFWSLANRGDGFTLAADGQKWERTTVGGDCLKHQDQVEVSHIFDPAVNPEPPTDPTVVAYETDPDLPLTAAPTTTTTGV